MYYISTYKRSEINKCDINIWGVLGVSPKKSLHVMENKVKHQKCYYLGILLEHENIFDVTMFKNYITSTIKEYCIGIQINVYYISYVLGGELRAM